MDNWNYEKAVSYVDSIQDPIPRMLTKLFLDSLTFFVAERKGYPEKEFDLLFFVQAISAVTREPSVLRAVLDGKPLDDGWDAIAEVWGEPWS